MQALNGLAGPISMTLGTVLSATWFPTGQRTTATSVFIAANNCGVALSFVLGPYLITDPGQSPTASAATIRTQIMHYM